MKEKPNLMLKIIFVFVLLLAIALPVVNAQNWERAPQATQNHAFSYQGSLTDAGNPANGSYDFEFKLYNSLAGGAQVGSTVLGADIVVSNGIFSTTLNFDNVFDGTALFLQIAVRDGASSGAYTTLSPRQSLTPAPYASGFVPGASVTGSGNVFAVTSTSGSSNKAISGSATNGAGNPVGVYGESADTNGRGVEGRATAASGSTVGVYAISENSTGYGVFAVGGLHGVKGQTTAVNGFGVWGTSGSGAGSYGVVGQSNSASGAGVWGVNSSTGGFAYGLRGEITGVSGTGIGVFGKGPFYGIRGEASLAGVGVQGVSDTGLGVYGSGNQGVLGSGSQQQGVMGYTTATITTTGGTGGEGPNAGVVGKATASSGLAHGVYGTVTTNNFSAYGVHGEAPGTGVYGVSTEGATGVVGRGQIGVSGIGGGLGVFGQSSVENGGGLHGVSYANTGIGNGVYGRTESPSGNGGYFFNDSASGGTALYAVTDANSGDIIVAANNASTPDVEFRVNSSGNVYADAAFNGGGADYAEMMPAVANLEASDVLVIGPDGRLTQSSEPFQNTVIGVYSTQPGFIAGSGDDQKDLSGHIPLAVMGVVPVKISAENGSIMPGDMLVASNIPGHAMFAGDNPPQGTVIGKALQGFEKGEGVIMMMVMLQ